MSAEDKEPHGNSVAAWVSVVIMMVGFLVAALAVMKASHTMFYAGIAAVVVGAILWPVLARMGYGDKNPPRSLYS
jgi:hypothetical protein